MKKGIIVVLMAISGYVAKAQVGINCQYVPGLQVGVVKVKTNNAALGNYKYSAGMPLMMMDRLGNHWYTNLDFNATYYAATQTNKANSDKIAIAKTEGGYAAGRLGYLFGKGDQSRFGFSFNLGYSASNLDSTKKVFEPKGYVNLGGGLVYYQKFGKFRFVGKVGYEKFSSKSYIDKAHGFYVETTLGYMIYQKYGVSIMPCFYSKSFDYKLTKGSLSAVPTEAKLTSFVVRFGLTKFF